jgi:hypothetical protein
MVATKKSTEEVRAAQSEGGKRGGKASGSTGNNANDGANNDEASVRAKQVRLLFLAACGSVQILF